LFDSDCNILSYKDKRYRMWMMCNHDTLATIEVVIFKI
jgi:hypothetical protein